MPLSARASGVAGVISRARRAITVDRRPRARSLRLRPITGPLEAIAIFVRFWVTNTSSLPGAAQPAAQAKARERYEGFVEALVRRLAKCRTLADEVSAEIAGDQDRPY